MRKILFKMAATIGLSMVSQVQAEEGQWMYAQGADTLSKGAMEYKLGVISRRGKDSGDYVFNDIRPEIEYGITDRLTLSAEVMVFDHDYSVDDPELTSIYETQGGDGGRLNAPKYVVFT